MTDTASFYADLLKRSKRSVEQTVCGYVWGNFFITLDCFGQEFDSAIGGHPVAVLMPGLDDEYKVTAPKLTALYLDPLHSSVILSDGSSWARRVTGNQPRYCTSEGPNTVRPTRVF
jgi:hypothetical protein